MSNTNDAELQKLRDQLSNRHVVSPDPDKLAPAAGTVAGAVAPYLPQRVRVTIYTAGGVLAVALPAVGDAVGGTIGTVLTIIGGVCGAVAAAVAVSHATPDSNA